VHGDYRNRHMLFPPKTGPALCGCNWIWELSTPVTPNADLAAVLMHGRLPPGKRGARVGRGDRAPPRVLMTVRICGRLLQTAGIAGDEHSAFYRAFAFFRMGSILQGVLKRALTGMHITPNERANWVVSLTLFFCPKAGWYAATQRMTQCRI